jgi:anti-sigma B factor antagonist
MNITTSTVGNVSVLAMEGNLMGGPDGTAMNAKLRELIDAGARNVVLDLGKLQFMNSSGLSLLIGGASAMKNAGGALKLCCASEKITALIKITRLEGIFESHPTLDAAVASFRK